MKKFILILYVLPLLISCTFMGKTNVNETQTVLPKMDQYQAKSDSDIQDRLNKYTEFTLDANLDHLSEKEQQLVGVLIEVADIMGNLFWEQVIGQKDSFLTKIPDENTRKFAEINYGPWDRLDNDASFIEGIGPKPAGANFYPPDMTKEEFDALNNEDKTSLYTLIRRDDDGNLKVVWYHEAYQEQLEKASDLLKVAAKMTDNAGLKKYLAARAEALVTDRYQPSDFAWMQMKDANIDFVVGAVENYEDKLYGYKAAFEAFVLIKDIEWSEKLEYFAQFLPELQDNLPVEDKYKQEEPGSETELNAYDVVYYAGDCNAGSKTIAINLPNDEEVQLNSGSRRLQLKNSMRAKFDKILIPISEVLIVEEQRKHITFDAFFENTMFHEVAHGLGIKNTINDKGSAREALKETYSAIEEGKADILGLYMVTELYGKGELKSGELMDNYVTFMAGIFRSVRFGASSAHGKANMMRFNFFAEKEAFVRDENGQYKVDFENMKTAMNDLSGIILNLQGDGDYEGSKKLLEEMAVVPDQLKADLELLEEKNIPVDIVFNQGRDVLGLN